MPTPFPGMDPYLEDPRLWQDVHTRLITAMGNDLGPRLSPDYIVSVEARTYIASVEPSSLLGRPDVVVAGQYPPFRQSQPNGGGVAVLEPFIVTVPIADETTERYLEIRDAEYGDVVTVIEVLSPDNKRPGSRGHSEYLAKRETVLSTRTSLVEIDLLRAGQRPPIHGDAPDSDYRIVIVRGWERPRASLYAFDLQDPIPVVPIPLERGNDEPPLDLNALFHRLYDQAVYNLRIDYRQPPAPPLDEAAAAWAAELVESRQADK